ncbi:Arylsulfotransferase-domain-containing protein [Xylariaceae sp. FL1019]|nr:Arylsulfotransferase-domain-containing protein [Xylariaceae sp. FL1019]
MFALCGLFGLVALFAQPARSDELITDYEGYNAAEYGVFPRLKFKSVDLDAPMLQVTTWNKERISKSGSHIFIRHDGNHNAAEDAAPLILSAEDLSVVYINRTFDAVFDVRVQQNGNQSYLTFYGGPMTEVGLGNGYAHAYDSQYNEVYTIAPQHLRVKGDLHECQFTGNGTVLVTAYEARPYDLTMYHGWRNAQIVDSVFQEINLETNEVLFEWRASKHIDMASSYESVKTKWDFFHLNSIEKTKEGNFLLSSRHMHAIYLVSGQDGHVIWTLGGKNNDFIELPAYNSNSTHITPNPVLTMSWQHHARFYQGNENEITLFDNHVLDHNGVNCIQNCSRGIHFAINTTAVPPTVRLLNEYLHPDGMLSQSQGSVQVLDDKNVFVGWGRNPSFTEHTPDGETVLSVQFSPWRSLMTANQGLDNYRAFRMDWKATPYWPPDIHVQRMGGNGSDVAYLSWNGATEVRSWVLFASDSPWDLDGAEKVVARLARAGFETTIPVGSGNYTYFRAAALDTNQTIIGSTHIMNMITGNLTEANYTITDFGVLVTSDQADIYAAGVAYALGWGVLLGVVLFSAFALGCVHGARTAWWQTRSQMLKEQGSKFRERSLKLWTKGESWRRGQSWTRVHSEDPDVDLEDGEADVDDEPMNLKLLKQED